MIVQKTFRRTNRKGLKVTPQKTVRSVRPPKARSQKCCCFLFLNIKNNGTSNSVLPKPCLSKAKSGGTLSEGGPKSGTTEWTKGKIIETVSAVQAHDCNKDSTQLLKQKLHYVLSIDIKLRHQEACLHLVDAKQIKQGTSKKKEMTSFSRHG